MSSVKMQKGMALNNDPPKPVGVQHATGVEQRSSSGKNEEAEPKQQ